MKILLIGEYSGVHSELKQALLKMGHHVTLISDGDSYKKFNSDFEVINDRVPAKFILTSILYLCYDFSGLAGLRKFLLIWRNLKLKISGYDVVQLINPIALSGFGSISNLIFLNFLKKHNDKIYLSALGDDYYWVKSCYENGNKYEALKNINIFNFYFQAFSTKYTHGLFYKYLNNYAIRISKNVIPGLFDYQKAYSWSLKCSKLVPLPIDSYKIGTQLKICPTDKIIIFHGWQKGKELRKGNDVFDRVIKRLLINYPNRIDYQVISNVSYETYINKIKVAHIALDQCFSYDKGMNGLLYMALGKVTFTGLEPEALQNYLMPSSDQIGVNAKKDENYLYLELEDLILNPDKIERISRAAIEFVKLNHTSENIVKQYIKIWTSPKG